MIVLPLRENYEIDQGQGFRDRRRLICAGQGCNFAGSTATLDLRVEPENPVPAISVSTLPSSSGLVGFDVYGNYWWDVYPSVLAALTPIQRALYFALRVVWSDGLHRDDLITGMLFQRRNLGTP